MVKSLMIRPDTCGQAFMGGAFDHPGSDPSWPDIDTAMEEGPTSAATASTAASGDQTPPGRCSAVAIDFPPRHPVQTLNSRSVTVRDAWPSTWLISTPVRHGKLAHESGVDRAAPLFGRPPWAATGTPRPTSIEAQAPLTEVGPPPTTKDH
jgi:hypothetical protein